MDIILTTLNSTYQHTAFGLRYLQANLKEFRQYSEICEFTISQSPQLVAEKILNKSPKIVGLGIYIWNVHESEKVIQILKSVNPGLIIVVGGPEVSYEQENQAIVKSADYVICGEGEKLFYEFCRNWREGVLPKSKIIDAELPDIKELSLPYELYSEEDLKNRILYVEASRGCPYKCEYCLSSLDKQVRNFNLDHFLNQMSLLIKKGAREFKFVDRTFNLSPQISTAILKFFLNHADLGLFLHFEMVPDRLPDELKVLIEKFPKGALQFEIGIQTWNPAVSKLVSRRQDYELICKNLIYLKEKTQVHTHVDLIGGLPGETLESFASGFNALVKLNPDEIQVGILKKLKGTPIARHEKEFEMIFQNFSPFTILKNSTMSFWELQEMGRFSKYWDLFANSGRFLGFMKWLIEVSEGRVFELFLQYSRFLFQRHGQSFGISLIHQFESAYEFMRAKDVDINLIVKILSEDFVKDKKRDLPNFLKVSTVNNTLEDIETVSNEWGIRSQSVSKNSKRARQNRHSK